MLKVVLCFSRHFSCHLQSEYILVGYFWEPYVGQGIGYERADGWSGREGCCLIGDEQVKVTCQECFHTE
jgi:hypothetical protein